MYVLQPTAMGSLHFGSETIPGFDLTLFLLHSQIWFSACFMAATLSHHPQTPILYPAFPSPLQGSLTVVPLQDSAFSSAPFDAEIYCPARDSMLLDSCLLG